MSFPPSPDRLPDKLPDKLPEDCDLSLADHCSFILPEMVRFESQLKKSKAQQKKSVTKYIKIILFATLNVFVQQARSNELTATVSTDSKSQVAGSDPQPDKNSLKGPETSAPVGREASDVDDAAIRKIADSVAASKVKLGKVEVEKRRILASLFHVQKRMRKISEEKERLSDSVMHTEGNVQSIAKKIAGIEAVTEAQRSKLKKRLRALYKISGENILAIIFSQKNSSELDQALRYLKLISDYDRKLIAEYTASRKLLVAKRDSLKNEIRRLAGLKNSFKNQEVDLSKEYHSKSKLVSELDHSTMAQMKRIQNLRTRTGRIPVDANKIDQSLADMLRPSIYEQRGKLQRPTEGLVVRGFGLVSSQNQKIRLAHKGLLFKGVPGGAVQSIFDGEVAFVDHIVGHGITMVIDHGDHYYSVYSNIIRPQFKVGDSVARNQQIGFVAGPRESGARIELGRDDMFQTGQRGGLYFELRHFSEAENPVNWLAGDEVKVSALPGDENVSRIDISESESEKL
jgi:murein hydrolase activator